MPSKVSEALGQFALTLRPASPFIFEFLGTLYLTMTALLGGGLAAALVLMPLIYIGGHVSGAHLNPAVSLVSFLIFPDRLSLLGTLAYMACQTAGAFVGAFLGWLITNSTSAPVIDQFGRAFVAELGFTSLLLVTALTAFAGHEEQCSVYVAIAVGAIVGSSFLCNEAVSGSVLNPALGLAIVLVNFINQGDVSALKPLYIYMTAPFLAVIVAIVFFLVSGYHPLVQEKLSKQEVHYDRS